MNTATLVLVPGLSRSDWSREAPGRSVATADLKLAFPPSPVVLEATLWTGLLPRKHGVLDASTAPPASPLDEAGERLRVVRIGELLTTTPGSPTALPGVRNRVEVELEKARPNHLVIVIGGPCGIAVTNRIEASSALDWQVGGSFLRRRGTVSASERERLLRTPGVERVLQEEGLDPWGLPADETWVIAEPGYSFDESATVTVVEGSFVLGAGPTFDWPDSVHDVRIAPTLARFLGLEATFPDRPLR